ncbi:cbb3-type cytochrome oxidase maturation protein [Rhodopseudomonas julia]|uniref:Cbb3-type cytochrome oxidase maturation protein n=1 Tax=Rhodopseudomonas julia TaxID=200617 RepID=A0ABU0C6R7_9BRAD|nr:cbb3-type cytochrome oxidase assembly protein CcoS [Rhodopseudomonas julia]MDQ0326206.1 cbb3-type cytochrome oxidase maturation protein [Rhodopseudomonas julia]
MTILVILIPAALFLGALGLAAFLWSLKSGQYDDLDGAAARILLDDEPADGERRKEAREEEDAAQHV